MRIFKIIFPFIYSALFIVLPIYLLRNARFGYAYSTLFLFWIPTVLLMLYNFGWMSRQKLWYPFLLATGIVGIITIPFEYIAVYILKVWTFEMPLAEHYIWQIPLLNIPIEEFIFWFGATPFCQMVYIYYLRLDKKRSNYAKFILEWLGLAVIFIELMRLLNKLNDDPKALSQWAMILLVSLFWITLAVVEYIAINSHFWIYCTGHVIPWPFKIPLEEFLIYYILPPIFVVQLLHFIKSQFDERTRKPGSIVTLLFNIKYVHILFFIFLADYIIVNFHRLGIPEILSVVTFIGSLLIAGLKFKKDLSGMFLMGMLIGLTLELISVPSWNYKLNLPPLFYGAYFIVVIGWGYSFSFMTLISNLFYRMFFKRTASNDGDIRLLISDGIIGTFWFTANEIIGIKILHVWAYSDQLKLDPMIPLINFPLIAVLGAFLYGLLFPTIIRTWAPSVKFTNAP